MIAYVCKHSTRLMNDNEQLEFVGRGRNWFYFFVFVAYETRSLPYKVTAKIFLVPVTLLKGNACDELFEGKCPVEKGVEFAYEHNILVKDKFPAVSPYSAIDNGHNHHSWYLSSCFILQWQKNWEFHSSYYFHSCFHIYWRPCIIILRYLHPLRKRSAYL